ncbi:type II CAAX endopeptidase family protein [Jatrophihabitans sp.]|uniref:CPBP family intramembrane glutamic endopeptidase n=1 Tax=Jatrophihabitans sp. TaxID=1932789 RepID=UPI0030C71F2C|nr:Abortive infection protein [Jatrophihabitans sp.]
MSAAVVPEQTTAGRREYFGLELWAVLGVSFGISGLTALLSLIRDQITIQGGIANANVSVVSAPATVHEWLDLLDDLAQVLNGLGPPFLVVVLLLRSFGRPGLGIGLDRIRRRELLGGVGLTALIGLPGLALVWLSHELGFNGHLIVVSFPDVWYRVPVLLLDAFQNGAAEELVVLAFMLTRLRQLGWSNERAVITSATLRGSYHLYQGVGAFFGNMVMGLIFGTIFQRTRRVWPFVIAHTLLDAFSFVGYVYLHNHIDWI